MIFDWMAASIRTRISISIHTRNTSISTSIRISIQNTNNTLTSFSTNNNNSSSNHRSCRAKDLPFASDHAPRYRPCLWMHHQHSAAK